MIYFLKNFEYNMEFLLYKSLVIMFSFVNKSLFLGKTKYKYTKLFVSNTNSLVNFTVILRLATLTLT